MANAKVSDIAEYNVPQLFVMYPDGTGLRLMTPLNAILADADFSKHRASFSFEDNIQEKVFTKTLIKVEDNAVYYREVI